MSLFRRNTTPLTINEQLAEAHATAKLGSDIFDTALSNLDAAVAQHESVAQAADDVIRAHEAISSEADNAAHETQRKADALRELLGL